VGNCITGWIGVNTLQGQATHVAPASVHATKVDEKRSFLLPVLALIIFAALFAFIFRACTEKPQLKQHLLQM
jgi:hypothetical protein